tara:strand:- start:767 stop:4072 length:3306 start_codon:yes stop_codon:yes gene_type:complete
MATLEELNKKLLEIESNNQNTNIEELNKILAEEDKEEDFVSAEEAGIKINPSELLSKDADKDLVDQIKEKNKDIKKELPKPGSAEELNARLEVMEGSILDGGTLEPDIEEIIEKEGYYSWENFSENLIKRTFVGAARDTLQGSIDFTNYIGNKFFDERPFENVKLPKIAEPTYFGGSFSRDITGFAIPFLGITKAANSLNLITKIPKATTKAGAITQFVSKNAVIGGLAEQFAFSPYETRVSNLVESFPTLANPITEYLQATDQDSEDKARFKMAIEGGLIGIPLDFLLSFIGRGKVKNLKTEKIKNNDDAVKNFNNKRKKLAENIEEATTIKPKSLEGNLDLNSFDRLDDVSEKIISQKTSKKIEGFFEDVLKGGKVKRNPLIRISDQIYDVMTTPRLIKETDFNKLLTKHKITADELLNFFRAGARTSAQNLNRLSQLSKAYGKFLKDGKVSKNLVDELNAQGIDTADLATNVIQKLDGVRRAMMVGRWSTAMRNFISQAGRVGIDVLNQSFQYGADQLWQKLSGKTLARSANPVTAMQGFLKIFRQINPKTHKKVKADVDKILASLPKENDRLFLRYSSDIINDGVSPVKKIQKYSPLNVAEKAANLLNFLNKFQEFITRRAVFLSSLDAIVRNNKSIYGGRTLGEIVNNPNLINRLRKQDIAAAVDHSLELTYASAPEKGFAAAFVKAINKAPFVATLVVPFPRFLVNSLKFLYEYSPLPTFAGAGRAVFVDPIITTLTFSTDGTFTKSFFKRLKEGDTSGLTKAIVGWGLFGVAAQIRDSKIAGEKWNEIKVANKTIDIFPYNPLAAYLFVADFIDRWQDGRLGTITGTTKDFAKVFLGTRGGTGLYAIDQLLESIATADSNKGYKFINETVGLIASQYFTPFKTYMGFLDAADGNIQAAKDTKTSSLDNAKINPLYSIKNNLKSIFNPGELPDRTSPTHAVLSEDGTKYVARPVKNENIVLTELTGVTVRQEKNSAEKEFDNLNFRYNEIFRSTGIPVLDRAFKNLFAPKIHLGLSAIIDSAGYQSLDINMRRLVIKQFIQGARKETMEELQADASLVPYLMEYNFSQVPKDQLKIIYDAIGKDYLNTLIKEFQN